MLILWDKKYTPIGFETPVLNPITFIPSIMGPSRLTGKSTLNLWRVKLLRKVGSIWRQTALLVFLL